MVRPGRFAAGYWYPPVSFRSFAASSCVFWSTGFSAGWFFSPLSGVFF
ncbi:hypothetical protein ACFQU7_09620 [Pseudoroseomonas wenyumeiae]